MESSPHILIVDDDREIRDLLSRILVKNGYRSATAWFRNATTPPSPGKGSVNLGWESPVNRATIPTIRKAMGAGPFVTPTVAAGVAAGRLEFGCQSRVSSCPGSIPRP